MERYLGLDDLAMLNRQTNTNQFVVRSSLDAARADLADQSELRLPPEQWEAFCERLDAPPQVIPALFELFKEPEILDGRVIPNGPKRRERALEEAPSRSPQRFSKESS